MRKVLLMMVAIVMVLGATAQKDTSYWKTDGYFGVKMSQSGYKNWSAGGENSISGIASFKFHAAYNKGPLTWDNLFLTDLGAIKQGNDDLKKTDDRLDFNTKLGYKANDVWFYTALFNFRTQYMEGYDYSPDTPVYISNFMAPAFIKLALGMDYKPSKNFTLFLSPATVRWTIVNDQELANKGAFGLDPAEVDAGGHALSPSGKVRTEMGAYLRFAYSKDIMENINFATKLELYSNYLDNPQNVDVDWELMFTFKVNKYFDASFLAHLIYDDDVPIGVDSNGDGTNDRQGPRLQSKEVIGLGISYKF